MSESDLSEAVIVAVHSQVPDATEEEIRACLTQHISSTPQERTRRKLRLTRLQFSGSKSGDFTFHPGVNVLCAPNFRGKSSVMQMIQFCLTGRDRLRDDIRPLVNEIKLHFWLDEQPYEMAVDLRDTRVKGALRTLTADEGEIVFQGANGAQLESKLEDFWNDQLGLSPISGTQKDSSRESLALRVNKTSFAAFFQGLCIHQETGYQHLVTEHYQSNQYTKIAGSLLGLLGLKDLFAIQTALHQVTNEIAVAQSRLIASGEQTSRSTLLKAVKKIEHLEKKILAKKLEQTKLTEQSASVTTSDSLIGISTEIVEVIKNLGLLEARQVEAEAAMEAMETRSLFIEEAVACKTQISALTPHHCPLCNSSLRTPQFQQRLRDGRCLLCFERVREAASAETLATFATELAESRATQAKLLREVRAGEKKIGEAKTSLERLNKRKETIAAGARNLFAAMQECDDEIDQLHLQMGQLVSERDRLARVADEGSISDLTKRKDILEAALDSLRLHVDQRNAQIRQKFAENVLALAHRWGFSSLESVEFDYFLVPRLRKNGVDFTFPRLSPGEKLRFVLAFYLAMVTLPRTGKHSGLHPGLLLIDSPGKEEANESDVAEMAKTFREIDSEYSDSVQIIIASKHEEIIQSAPAEKVRHVRGSDFLF